MENVGGIQYTVEANTGQLLKAEQDTVRSVDKIDRSLKGLSGSSKHVSTVSKSIKDLGSEAEKSGFKISKMQTAILGLATVTTVSSIAKMADDYRTLSERVRFAVNSQEEYELVQQRLIKSANESYRSLSEASEVFIGTSDNLRSLGFSLNESLDIADSLSFAFVKNATSAEQARNALRQYDVALNKGKVDMMGWQVINNAVPTLAKDIADSLGVTTQEVLNMGIASEITATMLNDALLKSFDSNRDAAMGMATSIEDAFTKLKTNLTVFVGETNKTVGATNLVASAIDLVSENIEELANIMIVAGAGAVAKYVTQFGIMTVAKMKDAIATRASIVAEVNLAKKNLEAAQAEVARTSALLAKGVAHSKNAQAIQAHTLAVANLDRAQKAAAISTRGLLSILGGPAGIIGLLATAGAGMALFASKTHDTSEAIEQLKQPLDQIIERFEKLNAEQKAQALIEYDKAKAELMKQEAQAADDVYNALHKMNVARYKANQTDAISISQMKEYREEIQNVIAKGGDIIGTIEQIAVKTNMSAADTKAFIDAAAGYTGLRDQVREAAKAYDALAGSVNDTKNAVDGLTEAQRIQNTLNAEGKAELEKLAKSFRDSANSARDNGSALARAKREIAALEAEGKQLDETLKNQILTDAEYIDSKKKVASATNSNVQVLRDLQKELELATLSGRELAIAQAESRLTEFATQTEVQAVRDMANALYDLQEAQKFGKTKKEQDEYIEGDVGNLSGGSYDDQVARYERDAELEQQRYADQLERLTLAREQQLQTEEEFNDLEYELQQKHNERMGRIEQAKNEVRLKSYASAAQSIADVLAKSNDEQSGFYKAAFAVAKGFAIADATVNAWNAISKAWASAPFPANLGAVAATTPAVMGVVSAIQGTSYGGGRQYGGYVSPDKYYRINETGMPEIYNDRSGNQYMLPTSGGSITPANKIANQSGGANVTINLIENPDRGGEVSQSEDDRGSIVDIFVADINSGGEMASTLESTYSLVRRGN